MFDPQKISVKSATKLGLAVTILVLTSACAHESVPPANNDSAAAEAYETTPEPLAQEQTSPLSGASKSKHKHGKHVAAKSRKSLNSKQARAQKMRKHKTAKSIELKSAAAAMVAPAQLPPPPPAPYIPAQVSMEATAPAPASMMDRILGYWAYALVGVGLTGLLLIAPKARRLGKPKRRLQYNS